MYNDLKNLFDSLKEYSVYNISLYKSDIVDEEVTIEFSEKDDKEYITFKFNDGTSDHILFSDYSDNIVLLPYKDFYIVLAKEIKLYLIKNIKPNDDFIRYLLDKKL